MTALWRPPNPFSFIHVAAGTSRLINSEPTGESAAAQICIHLSEPRGWTQRRRDTHSCPSRHLLLMQWTPEPLVRGHPPISISINAVKCIYPSTHIWHFMINHFYISWKPRWFLCEMWYFFFFTLSVKTGNPKSRSSPAAFWPLSPPISRCATEFNLLLWHAWGQRTLRKKSTRANLPAFHTFGSFTAFGHQVFLHLSLEPLPVITCTTHPHPHTIAHTKK